MTAAQAVRRPGPSPALPAHPRAVLGIILAAYFMILLDNSVIFTGLPSIRSGMNLSTSELSWVQNAYTLVFGGLLLLGSRAGDIVGRRRLFVAGLLVFSTASFLIGIAPVGWWLVASRAVQGVGAAIVAPASLSLLTAHFPAGPERSRAVAWYAATAGIGASLGLVVGGALAAWISWRAGFFVNVPIGIAMVFAARRYLHETPRSTARFDVPGALLATFGVGSLVYGIVTSAHVGWASYRTVTPLVLGAVLLAGLVAHESRAEQPIMPLRLFASRERSGAYAARMLFLGAMISFFFFTTQYLQGVFGWTPLQAGLGFLPMTAVNFAVAVYVPRLIHRLGDSRVLVAGIAVTAAGMTWLCQVNTGQSYLAGIALPMMLIGAGQGLAFAPMTSAGIAGVDTADAGAASGLVNTAHQLGSALGLGILVTVAAVHGTDLAGHITAALAGSAVLLTVALVVAIAVVIPGERSRRIREGALV
jgi:EmrB/QacA subfamily drug resistance transporter